MTVPALLPTYAPFPPTMQSAAGEWIHAEDGSRWLDLYGGHCVASTGHCHPKVVEAIAAQAGQLIFYSTAGAMRVRTQAAEALIDFARGAGVASVFFCNSGAEANENALKIAKKLTGRSKLAGFTGGWHGRSLSCLSVTDDPKITTPYADWLPPALRLPFNDLAALDTAPWSELAAVILEPVQSLAGVVAADPAWLTALAAKARAAGTLLILDEIQTGVGRLGQPYAAEVYGVQPDLITSAKGLASGVPIGAVLMREEIAAALKPGDLGSTFGGGPIACAALIATLDVIRSEALMERALVAEARIRAGLTGTAVTAVRGQGLLLGLESPTAAALRAHYLQHRVLVGTSSDPAVLRLMPPLTLTDAAIDLFLDLTRTHA
jgi:acetylornithine/N-succinyldiaminopimelate aminotransferase